MTKHKMEFGLDQSDEGLSKKQFLAYEAYCAAPVKITKVSEKDAAQFIETGFASAAN